VEEGREAPSASEPDREADAVHVMTIYGAKGLDFEHVYLAQINKRTGAFGSSPAAVLRRFEGLAELSLFGWSTPSFQRAEDCRELQARAERVRLLYVAMTRAKQRLVVSGGWSEPGETIDPLQASTLADLVAHRGDPEVIRDLIERGVDREAGMDPGVSWVIPALAEFPDPDSEHRHGGCPLVVGDDVVTADAEAIAAARLRAHRRMDQPWTAAASDAAQRSLDRMETEFEEDDGAARPRVGRSAAAAIGTAVHHLFETIDLACDLDIQVGERRQALIDAAAAGLEPDEAQEVEGRLERLMDRLPTSQLLRRLSELAPTIVARELPVLLRPSVNDGTSVISGAVDLVYRDPSDGCVVIADYKTDRAENDAEIAGRVEKYRPQLETYARALEEALSLEHTPHRELWFLQADRIVRL
jgi:ATP-dependent helicase/nuclease subunit A